MSVAEDRIAIRDLTVRYSRAVDDRDLDAFADTFVPEGTMELVGLPQLSGRQELMAAAEGLGYGTVHMTLDAVVDVTGDRATQVATLLLAKRQQVKSTWELVTTGRYTDEFIRTAAGWRFRHRRVDIDLDIDTVYITLTGSPAPRPPTG
ncbi:nuclear transport factor 2 family protein [Mycobacterium genavense]|uniref:nuclear transport factor 2 family protein n=1 Tax=Mycobacterium genavense TaxID=36812 RepID=UPI000472678D|nr:nuclear transport factor 2 family protein [Mycobacterium genavense]